MRLRDTAEPFSSWYALTTGMVAAIARALDAKGIKQKFQPQFDKRRQKYQFVYYCPDEQFRADLIVQHLASSP
jgi:hypothetical protein